MSLILYHDEEQRLLAEKSREQEQEQRKEIFVTEIKKFTEFYPAEEWVSFSESVRKTSLKFCKFDQTYYVL